MLSNLEKQINNYLTAVAWRYSQASSTWTSCSDVYGVNVIICPKCLSEHLSSLYVQRMFNDRVTASITFCHYYLKLLTRVMRCTYNVKVISVYPIESFVVYVFERPSCQRKTCRAIFARNTLPNSFLLRTQLGELIIWFFAWSDEDRCQDSYNDQS